MHYTDWLFDQDLQDDFDIMSGGDGNAVIRDIWRSRVILLAAFGLVGGGAVFGAGSVYYFYLRSRMERIFQIQSSLTSQIQNLRKDMDKVSQTSSKENGIGNRGSDTQEAGEENGAGDETVLTRSSSNRFGFGIRRNSSSSSSSGGSKRTVRFRDGYETADDEEYVTASSDSDVEIVPIMKNRKSTKHDADNLDIPVDTDDWIIDFLKETDKLLDGNGVQQHEAYIRLQSYKEKDKLKNMCGFWWRYAKASHMEATAAGQAGDSEQKKSLILAAHTRASKALQLDDKSANAHKWYAITIGSKGEYLAVGEKIKNGYTFKEHVDKAVTINPKDPSLHYLLGRFCLEVATLGWMERKLASTLFSSPPNSTPQEALQHFQASERLGKPLKDNRLYMAKCYIVLKNNEKAAYWLKMCVDMPNVSSSDLPIHDEATKLFSKYRQYLR